MDAQTLRLIKLQCRIDDIDDTGEDALLEHYYEAAKLAVLREIEQSEDELKAAHGGQWPADALQVVLMLVDHQYENRTAGANGNQALDLYAKGTLAHLTKLSKRTEV